MKAKIFEALKREYSPLGLGDEILQAQAGMLATLGFVNDENLSEVVAAQKDNLALIQKQNDSRVNNAINKAIEKYEASRATKEKEAREKAEKAAAEEAENKRKTEETKAAEKAKAEKEKAEKEAAEKAAAEEAERLARIKEDEEIPAWFKREMEQSAIRMAEADKKHAEEVKQYRDLLKKAEQDRLVKDSELAELLKTLKEKNETLQSGYDTLVKESNDLKAAKAASERAEFIRTKATALGIPEWRQNEGFVIPSEADEAAIETMLSTVASNMKAHQVPSSPLSFPMTGDAGTPEINIDDIASAIVKSPI